eukprot:1184713-Prorocentrum_minimum.AAC.1
MSLFCVAHRRPPGLTCGPSPESLRTPSGPPPDPLLVRLAGLLTMLTMFGRMVICNSKQLEEVATCIEGAPLGTLFMPMPNVIQGRK